MIRIGTAFLVPAEDGYTLVDVGWAGAPDRISAQLDGRLDQIRRIVLTHAHPDHVQGVAAMKARTGAEVLIHEADAGWLAAGRAADQRAGGQRSASDPHTPAILRATSRSSTRRPAPCWPATRSSTADDSHSARRHWQPTRRCAPTASPASPAT